MPEKQLPFRHQYQAFLEYVCPMFGFSLVGSEEEKNQLIHLGIEGAPRPQELKNEDALIRYSLNGYRAKIRTTIDSKNGKFKVADNDEAWAMIEDGEGKAIFYRPQLHRTKNFLLNLAHEAEIIERMVSHRTHCQRCGKFMIIVRVGLRDYRLECEENKRFHSDAPFVIDDIYEPITDYLTPDTKKYLSRWRSRDKYRRKKADEANKIFGESRNKRKKYKKRK